MSTYALVYLGAAGLAVLCTPIVVHVARVLNIMDMPGVRKIHAAAIPRIGGAAIMFGMLSMIVLVLLLDNYFGAAFRKMELRVVVLLSAGLFMFFVGLIDDVWDLRVRYKLLAQIFAAVVVCAFGIRIDEIALTNQIVVSLGWLAWPLTVFWIVGVTNAVNLIDGLDGLAAGIAAVTCGVIAIFAIYTGQSVMAVMMLALLGSLTGFLFFNFNPARIFMGDCGTMFLGFILAASSILCATKASTIVGLALPTVAMGVPIFDTFFSIIRRVLDRRSIFSPDRSHIHHRLLDMGLRHRHVVILMYLVTLVAAGLGLFMMFTRDMGTIIVFGCVLLMLLMIFKMVGAVQLSESIAAIQRNRSIARQAKEDQRVFDFTILRLREAKDFVTWWKVICDAAMQMEFVWLALPVVNRNGSPNMLIWHCTNQELTRHETIHLTVPVHDRRQGAPLRMEFAVHVNGSLETAGRRVALFSRMIDEQSPARIPKNPQDLNRNYTIIACRRPWKSSAVSMVSSAEAAHQENPEFQTI